MKILSILIGKILIRLLRLAGSSGSALPGLVIEKIYPKLIEKQLSLLPKGVVVVSGTNGKTTTTKAIVYLLEQGGLRVMSNPTGSNFTRGIYASLARYSKLSGGLDYDIAVLELDEAYSRKFVKLHRPDTVLLLNIMRDQLDRYGEIDVTKQMLAETANSAKKHVIAYAGDERIVDIADKIKDKVDYYGSSVKLSELFPSDDQMYAAAKEHKGERKDLFVELFDYKDRKAVYKINHKRYPVDLGIQGVHNALNLGAALSVALRVNPQMKAQYLVPTLANFKTAFGRGEKVTINGKAYFISLVKNPSGFRQGLKSFENEDFDTCLIAINDNFADGRDVSWLWDVDYKSTLKNKTLLTTGDRAYDMTLRLKYDDLNVVNTDTHFDDALNNLFERTNKRAVIFCTYTAMLKIRKALTKSSSAMEDVW